VIDASRAGAVTGEFADTVNLNPGDHFLSWASEAGVELESLGAGYANQQLALMNTGGGAVVVGIGQSRDNTLPDKLGAITSGLPFAPILAYFKA
jgi:hypothetical protein